ncbi:magnesium and cobalt transport protein CorA [Nitratireductor aquibiodomus RA22]|uniref:Magnesium transport protein CorA n=2 Tax=Nitratireductor aquibiodomus TaxID=204799 RepID=A0A1H4J7S5_9HYPH|nr:magnesium transporter CorA family protein [Nitratireductor aquibiodomus]EIM72781.1 magnesium and cobalt transport protein CorA [Nitratireductor aquibiodomus RA22]SEB42399.1 magnesium transporter [Nitratireductor aquibiodomus]
MIKIYIAENGRLRPVELSSAGRDAAVWVDMLSPTEDEERAIEAWLGIAVPTRADMEEIEISSRLYSEDGAHYMTATLTARADGDQPQMGPVTFILSPSGTLVTLRFHEPSAFQIFPQRAAKAALGCGSGEAVLINLLEVITDRLADILERAGREILELSKGIFHPSEKKASKRDRDFQIILRRIGRKEDLISKLQDSLLTMQRLSGFLSAVSTRSSRDGRARIKTLSRDIASLADHATGLSQKIGFLLDATLGMISIEQSAIIKIFSVVAVIFLPPTLVASVYGMNFSIMPELQWPLGYPFAVGLMVLSALLPFWYFKRRGWL